MFRGRTLFIVGAGASKEANLPIGSELTGIIARSLKMELDSVGHQASGNKDIFAALSELPNNIEYYVNVAHRISLAMPAASSIDEFLDVHRDDKDVQICGKLAIVQSILEAERKSLLHVDQPRGMLDLSKVENTWFARFFRKLSSRVQKSNLKSLYDNISFVIFNYDRCVEQYLLYATMLYYNVDEEEALDALAKLKIFHPYGVVGAFAWKPGSGINFGDIARKQKRLVMLQNGIRTYTEQIAEQKFVAQIREEVTHADAIAFLGFGFHQQNIDLMTPSDPTVARRLYGTTMGISQSSSVFVNNMVARMLPRPSSSGWEPTFNFRNMKCYDLFHEFDMEL
jgi:hypothetical protein